LEYSLQK